MRDGLLVVDVFNDFDHEGGNVLLASFQERLPRMVEAIAAARAADVSVVYVNDQLERWDADGPGLVRSALSADPSGEVIAPLAPEPGDRFVLKPRYSGFDHTALLLLLQELQIERILLIGSATEGCVVQTGIGQEPHRERMTEEELVEEMRSQQIGSLDEVEWSILEANGTVSFIKSK
jgi:nicotinamidase-related amidase